MSQTNRDLDSPAGGGLEVEAYERKDLADGTAMADKFGHVGVPQGGQGEQAGVIPEVLGELRLGEGLRGGATNPGDEYRLAARDGVAVGDSFRGALEDGLEQPVTGIADAELCGVDAHREAAGTGRVVVAGQGTLAPLVQFPRGRQCQRMGGDDLAFAKLSWNPLWGQRIVWHRQ